MGREERISPETLSRVRKLAASFDAETLAEFILTNYWSPGAPVEDRVQQLAWRREMDALFEESEAISARRKLRHSREHPKTYAELAAACAKDLEEGKRQDAIWKRQDELSELLYGRPNAL